MVMARGGPSFNGFQLLNYFRLHPVLLSATRPRSCCLPRAPPQIGFVPQLPAPPRSCCLRHATGPALCRASRPQIGFVSQLPTPPRSCSLRHAHGPALCRWSRPRLASFRNFRFHPVLLSPVRPRFCSLLCAPSQIGFVPQLPAPPGFAPCRTPQVSLPAVRP